MKRLHIRKPSPALIIAVIALFVALGGTSYAATVLPAKSVGTIQLKNGAVTNAKIKAHAVSNKSFSATTATSVAEAGGTVSVTGTTPTLKNSFDRLSKTAITVTRTSVGRYEITIPGVNFFWSKQITQLSLLNSGSAYVARIDSINSHLLVTTYDLSGAAVDPAGFSFVVFK